MKFKKITAILGSLALVGLTIGSAIAVYPTSFIENGGLSMAIVYGSGSAPSDLIASNLISSNLKPLIDFDSVTNYVDDSKIVSSSDFSNSLGITEDEVVLGSLITNSKIHGVLLDNKIPSLLDGKVSWDGGDGNKNYDIHEEVLIGDMKVLSTFDDNELNSSVVLTNDNGLEYRYVFDDAFSTSDINSEDSDELYLNILGIEYEILSMEHDSITVSVSDEKLVKAGESFVVDGITLKVGDIYEGGIEINGNLIKEEHKKVVDGIEVFVDTIAYHSSATLPSKVILKVGKDIEQTFNNGEEYSEDSAWEWTIENPGDEKGYVGVKYTRKNVGYDEDEEEDNALGIEQGYIFPENYASVFLNGLTDVTYNDFELSFDDEKLYTYDSSSDTSTNVRKNVVSLEGENEDSISIGSNIETNNIYFGYESVTGEIDQVTMYFKDINGDIDSDHEGRIQSYKTFNFNSTQIDLTTLIVDDTEIEVGFDNMTLTLTKPDNKEIRISLGLNTDKDTFDRLGSEDEDAESTDLIVDGKNIGTFENDVLDHYGVLIKNPENNANDDEVVLSVPSEQVYASISVLGQGEEVVLSDTTNNTNETSTEVIPTIDLLIVRDTEIDSVKDRNLIVVGGSCINSVAAQLLGVPMGTCGADFTDKLNVGAGQFILQEYASPYTTGKVAMLVAGYNAADTTAGVNKLISQ